MLVLSRKYGEGVIIGDARLVILKPNQLGDDVRLGIEAPRSVPIYRTELAPWRDGKVSGEVIKTAWGNVGTD